ncbi:membrane protein [Beggiatoa sp. PS]|nr:membrane protein [Beggiatoa sp. PS]
MLTNRTLLFYLQSLIAICAMLIIGLILVPDLPEQVSTHLLKVTIAPFPSLSLLIFLLFVFNKIVRDLDDKVYSFREVLIGSATAIIILVVIFIGTGLVLGVLQSIDKKIFLFSLLLGLIIFCLLRVSNLYTMAIITGLSEGIILYIIFRY